MKVKGLNASAVRTKRRIRNAFLQMHSEKLSGNEMTVSDLARRAEISRTTFYTHYNDLDDVGNEIVDEMISRALEDYSLTSVTDILPFIENILHYFQENQASAHMLLGSDFPLAFMQQFKSMIKQKFQDIRPEDPCMIIRLSIVVDGMIEQLIYFFQGTYSCSFETLYTVIIDTCERITN